VSFSLDNYNTVAERIVEFRDKHPEGSLQTMRYELVEVPVYTKDKETGEVSKSAVRVYLAVTAAAYRTPDDVRPGVATAWEPIPGPTQFTRDSELQNAETAAYGRAIVACLAADTRKGIASREEVQARKTDW
jgi:hypothetical protein